SLEREFYASVGWGGDWAFGEHSLHIRTAAESYKRVLNPGSDVPPVHLKDSTSRSLRGGFAPCSRSTVACTRTKTRDWRRSGMEYSRLNVATMSARVASTLLP